MDPVKSNFGATESYFQPNYLGIVVVLIIFTAVVLYFSYPTRNLTEYAGGWTQTNALGESSSVTLIATAYSKDCVTFAIIDTIIVGEIIINRGSPDTGTIGKITAPITPTSIRVGQFALTRSG